VLLVLRVLPVLLVLAHGAPAPAQGAPSAPPPVAPVAPVAQNDALRVFLDCGRCDFDFLRTEITFVTYVRDRKQAEVHVLVTTQPTGSGGTEWVLKFIGLERFAGIEQTLTFTTPQTATDDDERRAFARTFKLGLVRYVAETPLADRIDIGFRKPDEQASPAKARDPWNYWFFRTSLFGFFESERAESAKEIGASIAATHTTEPLRINLSVRGEYEEQRFTFSDEGQFRNVSHDFEAGALAVKSLSPHWSAGLRANAASSTFLNLDFVTRIAPAVEYDVFPYTDWTRRRLTVQYTIGLDRFGYEEVTIFDRTRETLWDQAVIVSAGARQPWGSLNGSAELMHYLNDVHKNRIRLNGNIEVRLFKGFEFEIGGSYSRIRDQIYLPKGEASDEEVLVRRRQLATGYRYAIELGVTYSFGSIYNNIVNPRMSGRSGVFFID
jgi:hypothetical protein